MELRIEDLDFGALAAERDEGLRDYFVQSESYVRLRDGVRSVLLGNRGSGKSAIFKMVAETARQRGAEVIELAPEDYSYELLQQTMEAEKQGAWAKHGAYAAAWKYLIYVTAMKRLSETAPAFKRGSAAKIYEYLRDRHANFDANPVGVLISYLKRLEGIKIGKYEAAAKSRELHKLYKLEEIAHLLPDLNNLAKKHPVVILVDELDRGWDASEDAIAFVAGLFQATMSINAQTPNIRVLISLRKELYDNIPALYEDAQKVRDIIETIEWDEPSLLNLIALRIGHFLPPTKRLDDQGRWNTIFAETLNYRNTLSFNYIVDRTLYRPREIIQFCIETRSTAIKKELGFKFDYNVISEAEHAHSEARVKDIAAEYRFQYPGLLSVFETFRGGPYNFTRDGLELHCLEISTGSKPIAKEAKAWCLEQDLDYLIDVFWRIGFIRAQAVGGIKARRRSGSSYLGPHQISSLNLRSIGRFHIHPMFRASLGLKETTADC